MARLTRREATGPRAIKIGGETQWICMCGLTKNEPYCDSSHELCADEDEDKLYEYTEKGERFVVNKRDVNGNIIDSEEELFEKLKNKTVDDD